MDLIDECRERLRVAREALAARRAEMKAAHCARQKGRGGFLRGLWIEEMAADARCSELSRIERRLVAALVAAETGRAAEARRLLAE